MSYENAEVIWFNDENTLFRKAAEELKAKIEVKSSSGGKYFFAVSGGNSPVPLFRLIASEYRDIFWRQVELFWVDERMVPPDSAESNFGNAKRVMLDFLPLPSSNIHFINGLNPPERELQRYAHEINSILPLRNNLPVFDLIWLGLGDDGHTASIFPDTKILNYLGITGLTSHPVSKQKRITLTEDLINNAEEVVFIVTGPGKKDIVNRILAKDDLSLPAARINPASGKLKWYLYI